MKITTPFTSLYYKWNCRWIVCFQQKPQKVDVKGSKVLFQFTEMIPKVLPSWGICQDISKGNNITKWRWFLYFANFQRKTRQANASGQKDRKRKWEKAQNDWEWKQKNYNLNFSIGEVKRKKKRKTLGKTLFSFIFLFIQTFFIVR